MTSERAMMRGALIPTAVLAPITMALGYFIWGASGTIGALLAQFIVVVFFASNLLVARISRDLEPSTVMALAMVSYVAKVILLGLFLAVITAFVPEDICNRNAFGLSAVGATFTWLGGEIYAFLRLKLHLDLPTKKMEER
jgi:ATP synthase protein I